MEIELNYFSDKETVVTNTGIDNTPDTNQKANIEYTKAKMNHVREIVGKPVNVNSWFRSKKVNSMVGGSSTSAHLSGYAVDFWVKGMTNQEICDLLDAEGIEYDQLIDEYDGNRYWIHLSFDPKMRRERLIARPVNGKMKYTRYIKHDS